MTTQMNWELADRAKIDKDATYLVKTNGGEWRDADLHMRPGFSIPSMLEPNVVRGRALFVALITDPLE